MPHMPPAPEISIRDASSVSTGHRSEISSHRVVAQGLHKVSRGLLGAAGAGVRLEDARAVVELPSVPHLALWSTHHSTIAPHTSRKACRSVMLEIMVNSIQSCSIIMSDR